MHSLVSLVVRVGNRSHGSKVVLEIESVSLLRQKHLGLFLLLVHVAVQAARLVDDLSIRGLHGAQSSHAGEGLLEAGFLAPGLVAAQLPLLGAVLGCGLNPGLASLLVLVHGLLKLVELTFDDALLAVVGDDPISISKDGVHQLLEAALVVVLGSVAQLAVDGNPLQQSTHEAAVKAEALGALAEDDRHALDENTGQTGKGLSLVVLLPVL